MTKVYLEDLEQLQRIAAEIPNSPMMTRAKIDALIIMNMRYEQIMLDRDLDEHPYLLTQRIVQDTCAFLEMWQGAAFIESDERLLGAAKAGAMEQKHEDLFQDLWVSFSADEYVDRIERYVYRLQINSLGDGFLDGFDCIDFGCGHGNFAHALLREGARSVYGVDFGENSIKYATSARDRLGVERERLTFELCSVYSVPRDDASFDFALQNGVFHHLSDEDAAYREVARVLKPGGWFWVYTDGSGGISYDLWDTSMAVLQEVPHDFIVDHLAYLNIETGKRYHLGDGLNATYLHATWDELTERLSGYGFGNFRRLVGGFETDFDHDVIEADKYGREKFGEGDLRLLARRL